MNTPIRIVSAVMLVLVATANQPAEARSFRVGQVPNGSVFGCALCHEGGDAFNGGTPRNAFGLQVEAALGGGSEVDWGAVFDLDADNDGFTNGAELGDPDGDGRFVEGFPPTDPSEPNDTPQCVDGLGTCSDDGPSTEQSICVRGMCVERSDDPECADDTACGEGGFCETGRCIATAECAASVDCDPNTFCIDGECLQEHEITPCLGIVCTADEVCVDNVCVPADPNSNPEPNSGTGTTSEGTAEPATTTDEGQDSSGVDTEEDAGCHMTPGAPASSSGTLLWLVMMGLVWQRRRT